MITVHEPPATSSTFFSNHIVTSQYTALNFTVLNLWKQFHKLANCYFLVICVLQSIKVISITNGFPTTALPLVST